MMVSLPRPRPRSLPLVLLLLLGLIPFLATERAAAQSLSASAPPPVRQALEAVHGPDLQGKDGPLRKLGVNLALLHQTYDAHRQRGKAARTFVPADRLRPLARVRNGTVVIDALAASGQGAVLFQALQALGLANGARAGRLVSGRLPIEELADAGRLSALHSARLGAASTAVGQTTSQGDTALRTDEVRTSLGIDGTGVTVGVLSDTYDNSNSAATTAQDDIDSGDLPPASRITVLDDSGGPGIDEGRAMMQIIHDVAPGATLAFHTAFTGQANFAQGIRDLADAGSDVIVDDVIYFAEPMFQDGIIAQAADQVHAQGVPYFSSAGNIDRQSYASDYRETATGAFDFDPSGASTDTTQAVRVPVGRRAGPISFQWDDPYASAGDSSAATDLDIFLLDKAGNVVASGEANNVGGDPIELFDFQNDGSVDADSNGVADTRFQLSIKRLNGPTPTRVKYVYFGALDIQEYATNSPTSYGHANADGAVAVGAAFYDRTPEFGTSPPQSESFSSVGGVPILFDGSGTRLPSPVVRDKPEITAPDGGNTTFFGSFDPEGDGFPNFFGTSAAAPHAAALAALQLEADAALTPDQVLSAQQGSAIDMGAPGFDPKSGAGLVQAPQTLVPNASGPPDLAVSAMSIAPDTPRVDDAITHTAAVCNQGTGTAGPSTLAFSIAGEASPPTVSIPDLEPATCHTVSRSQSFSEAQTYQNRATADVNDAVSESDESNNEATLTYEVRPPLRPDLVVASITPTPSAPTIEDDITFGVEVCNAGTDPADPSRVAFQIGNEADPPQLAVSALDPDQCAVVERTEQLTEARTYALTATADAADAINELDEANNTTQDSIAVAFGTPVVTLNQVRTASFPEVQSFVSVTSVFGDPVQELSADHFDVQEDSVALAPASVEAVDRTGGPLSVVLVIDRSGSMAGDALEGAQAAARSLVDSLGAEDEAAVVSFAADVSVDQPLTGDRSALRSAIDGLTAEGRTAFFDGVAEALRQIPSQPGRTAILALVDGPDNESSNTLADVIALAQETAQPVFTVGLGDSFDAEAVQTLAEETGGRSFETASASPLQAMYQQILRQLQSQYRIVYTTPQEARDGTRRTVGVTARVDGASASDTRPYRAPQAAPTARNDTFAVAEDDTLRITDPANGVLANDDSPGSDSLTVSQVQDVSIGSLTLNADGTLEYIPAPDSNGTDRFVYEVADEDGQTDQATATITVAPRNDAPTAAFALPDLSLPDDAPAQLAGLRATLFSDVDGDALRVSATSSDTAVVAVSSQNGQIVLSPRSTGGPASVTLTAADDSTQTSVPVSVTVAAAPEEPVPTVRAVAPVATDGRVPFGDTGLQVDVAGASGGPRFWTVDYFADEDSTSRTATTEKAGLDDFDTVSPYRWTLRAGAMSFGVQTQVTFSLAALPDRNGGITDPSTVQVLQDPPGDDPYRALPTQVDEGGTPDVIRDDRLVASEVSEGGTFRLASNSPDNPLPVELTEFAATQDKEDAVLEWTTAAETRNAGFYVQHQPPASAAYTRAGFVEGAGTTDERHAYRVRIEDLAAGTHRFRLRQVDTDGRATLTDPVSLTVAAPRVLSLQATGPNPVHTATRLAFTVARNGPVRVALYNVLGQRVRVLYDREAGAGTRHTLDVATRQLPSGSYFVRLSAPSGTRTERIVVLR